MESAVRPIAVVVEDDYFQCELIKEILEANRMQVIRCDTAEAAELVVARTYGPSSVPPFWPPTSSPSLPCGSLPYASRNVSWRLIGV